MGTVRTEEIKGGMALHFLFEPLVPWASIGLTLVARKRHILVQLEQNSACPTPRFGCPGHVDTRSRARQAGDSQKLRIPAKSPAQ
jgi:hypothetical protein